MTGCIVPRYCIEHGHWLICNRCMTGCLFNRLIVPDKVDAIDFATLPRKV